MSRGQGLIDRLISSSMVFLDSMGGAWHHTAFLSWCRDLFGSSTKAMCPVGVDR